MNFHFHRYFFKKYITFTFLICLITISFSITIFSQNIFEYKKQEDYLYNKNVDPNLAQGPHNYYSVLNKTWGDSGDDEGFAIGFDSENNLYTVGHTFNTERNCENIVLIKYNHLAIQEWETIFGDPNKNTRGYDLTFDSNDDIYIVGSIVTSEPAHNIKLYKYDSSGIEILDKSWGWFTDDDYGRGVAVDSNNYIYVIGTTESGNNGYEIKFLKYDASGNQLEDKAWGGSSDDIGYDIEIDSNDNYYVTGKTDSYGSGSGDVVLIKFDSSGNEIWSKTWGNSSNDEGKALITDSNGDIYITGNTRSYGAGENDIILIKYNSSGNQYWNKTWGGFLDDLGMDIAIDANNNIIIVGSTENFGAGLTDFVLLKYNSSGDLINNQTWGGSSRDVVNGVVVDSNNIIYEVGTTESYGANSKDIILSIYSMDSDNDGLHDWSEIKEYLTNPYNPDTDGDGYSDGNEVSYGTNPLSALDNIETRRQLADLLFKIFLWIIFISLASVPILLIVIKGRRKIKTRVVEKIKDQELIEKIILEQESQFEYLISKSKTLIEEANKNYSKSTYEVAINNWNEAIKNYQLALQKAPSEEIVLKIKRNQKDLNKNICNAHIKNGKNFETIASKSHKVQNLEDAEKKWIFAKTSYQKAIEKIKSEGFTIDFESLKSKISSIDLYLLQIEIEKICLSADKKVERTRSLQNTDLNRANKTSEESYELYSNALFKAKKYPQFNELLEIIKNKMNNVRVLQDQIKEKLDEMYDITTPATKIIIDDVSEEISPKITTILKSEKRESALIITREYELKGGQIRFKIGLENNTSSPLTNFKINFDIPISLKWIFHEPIEYNRRGDTIYISKLGLHEKKSISLWLEPTQCLKSPVNATISFHDAKDKPQAITMNPKEISIECPLFFTESEANLAKVKSRHRSLKHCDRKLFPIIDLGKLYLIYLSVLDALGKHHIKLVYKEFSEKDKFGEAWYYGITKVKNNQIIIHFLLNGDNHTLELETSGDSEQQITALLAEVGNDIRRELKNKKLITSGEQFYDIKISIFSNKCPYCGGKIPPELVEKYRCGDSINCLYCKKYLIYGM